MHQGGVNPLTAECALRAPIEFTLSNARRFYSSMGNPLDRKGLKEIQNSNYYFTERNLWQFLRDSTDLFSLYVLFSHFKPRDATRGNSCFQMSSYARANVRITNDKNKRKIPMTASRGLKWENKMYKLKRSIAKCLLVGELHNSHGQNRTIVIV